MVKVIAVKQIGRTKPGETVDLPANQARAMIALGRAALAPKAKPVKPAEKPKPKEDKTARPYLRRDMVAEPAAGVVTQPAQTFNFHNERAVIKSDDGKA